MTTYLQAVETHYVYEHIRLDTGKVFYVGKGRGQRLLKTSSRNQHWKNVVSKCGGFKAEIIANGLTEDEAFNFEKLLISQIKIQTDLSLVNLNDGGKGGVSPSPETLEKMRLINLGRKHSDKFRENQRQNMLGNKMSDETRAKVSASLKGKPKSKEHAEKVSKALIGKKHTPEARLKISAAKKGKPPSNKGSKWSDETRAKIAAIWVKRRLKKSEEWL
jgi:hypothetical protein